MWMVRIGLDLWVLIKTGPIIIYTLLFCQFLLFYGKLGQKEVGACQMHSFISIWEQDPLPPSHLPSPSQWNIKGPPPPPSHNIFIPRGSRCWCKEACRENFITDDQNFSLCIRLLDRKESLKVPNSGPIHPPRHI